MPRLNFVASGKEWFSTVTGVRYFGSYELYLRNSVFLLIRTFVASFYCSIPHFKNGSYLFFLSSQTLFSNIYVWFL